MSELEEQFWGSRKSKKSKDISEAGEKNAKFFLALLFCMALFLWTGFQLAFIFPLEETEARPDHEEEVPAANQEKEKENYKQIILVMGGDYRNGGVGRTDTILLVFLDTKEKTVDLLNIPRDTYANIVGKNFKTKINHAYAYGGVDMAKDTVEEFLDIKVDHYVDINFDGFASLIDALGGITIDVEKRMHYPPENIDLEKGVQKLDGEQALAYVRFRSDGLGDLGRVQRQQKFLSILADRVLSLSTLWKIPKLVGIFRDNVDTDISLGEMLSLANTYKSFDVSNIKTSILPGEPEYINGISYFISDPMETARLIDELKTGKVIEETAPEEREPEETQKEQD